MTAAEAKAKVLAVHPDAFAWEDGDSGAAFVSLPHLGEGDATTDQAWIDAAHRLPVETAVATQPVGEPEESDMTIAIEEAIEELKELAMDEDYRPDSFTFQPLRIALTNAKKAAQPVGEPEPEEHPRADCEGCFRPDCPCNMNEDWLDAELRANGIDPHKLNQKMLERIEQSIAEGHDTPRLHEAHAAFKRAVEPKPAPQATPNASFEEWATSRGMRLLKITEKAGYYYTRTRHAFEGWNAAQAYYERKIADAEARAQKPEATVSDVDIAFITAVCDGGRVDKAINELLAYRQIFKDAEKGQGK